MSKEVISVIAALRRQLEDEGYTLYSFKPAQDVPTLIMYNADEKRFAVISYSPDEVGVYSRVDAWLHMAESKAETFGFKKVPPYRVFKDARGMWKFEVGQDEV